MYTMAYILAIGYARKPYLNICSKSVTARKTQVLKYGKNTFILGAILNFKVKGTSWIFKSCSVEFVMSGNL